MSQDPMGKPARAADCLLVPACTIAVDLCNLINNTYAITSITAEYLAVQIPTYSIYLHLVCMKYIRSIRTKYLYVRI